MAKTLRTHISNGTQTVYPVDFALGYLRKEFVYVYLGSDPGNQLNYSWLDKDNIVLAAPLPAGTEFIIRRILPRGELLNDYTDGAPLREPELDESFKQTLMIVEEIEDGFISLEDASGNIPPNILAALTAKQERIIVTPDRALVSGPGGLGVAASTVTTAQLQQLPGDVSTLQGRLPPPGTEAAKLIGLGRDGELTTEIPLISWEAFQAGGFPPEAWAEVQNMTVSFTAMDLSQGLQTASDALDLASWVGGEVNTLAVQVNAIDTNLESRAYFRLTDSSLFGDFPGAVEFTGVVEGTIGKRTTSIVNAWTGAAAAAAARGVEHTQIVTVQRLMNVIWDVESAIPQQFLNVGGFIAEITPRVSDIELVTNQLHNWREEATPLIEGAQPALGFTPENSALKGASNGYCPLDGGAKVPSVYLPSYVDDVITVANAAALPVTGETGKIYVTEDNNRLYRWSGSGYIHIPTSPGSTDVVPEGAANLYFTAARARAAITGAASSVAESNLTASRAAVSDGSGKLAASATTSTELGHLTGVTGNVQAQLNDRVTTSDSRLTDAREWTEATVGQTEAEEGTETTRRAWTAQRVRQAIAAWWTTVSGTKQDTITGAASTVTTSNLATHRAVVTDESGKLAAHSEALGTAAAATLTTSATDITTGRVLTVGNLGVGAGFGPSSNDVTSRTQSGAIFHYSGAAANRPSGSTGGVLRVDSGTATTTNDRVAHHATDWATGTNWTNTYNGTAWTGWRQLWDSGNLLNIGTTAASARSALGLGTAATATLTTSATDTSGGRVLKVGDHGVGVGVQVSDYNTLTVARNTNQLFQTNFQAAGYPSGSGNYQSGIIFGHNVPGDYETILATGTANNELYSRYKGGGVWGDWVRYYHTGNLLNIGTTAVSARSALGLGTAATADVTTTSASTTAGQVTKVGDYGWGVGPAVLTGADWNALTTPGSYLPGSTGSNRPPGVTGGGTLLVQAGQSGSPNNRATQRFIELGTRREFIRSLETTWNPWVEVWNSASQLALGTTADTARTALGLQVPPPATATSPGNPGEQAYDADWHYICVAANTWKRTALSSW